MNRGWKQGAVVVAVDDNGSARYAVDWAAAEAATRRCRCVWCTPCALHCPRTLMGSPR
ncbi:hypothetical protein FHX44_118127 [Pseudonocardia hierapolitana]|uniref:Universal stress protein family protein n=1 Tax=Pseudonocardia hierapolitana TaxID=1128676 RepID=A0A561T502_9PSEU|nr:hypothetical protein FHX44_118127 [Pseudonocardia hierapolitana]